MPSGGKEGFPGNDGTLPRRWVSRVRNPPSAGGLLPPPCPRGASGSGARPGGGLSWSQNAERKVEHGGGNTRLVSGAAQGTELGVELAGQA